MTSMLLSRILLATGASIELSIVAKVTVLLVFALLAVRVAKTARASVRHVFLAATFSGIAVLPLATYAISPVPVDIPLPVVESRATAFGNAGSAIGPRQEADVASRAETASAPPVSTASVLRAIWALGAAASGPKRSVETRLSTNSNM